MSMKQKKKKKKKKKQPGPLCEELQSAPAPDNQQKTLNWKRILPTVQYDQ